MIEGWTICHMSFFAFQNSELNALGSEKSGWTAILGFKRHFLSKQLFLIKWAGGGGGSGKVKKCHVLFEWPLKFFSASD